jgi:hypothetical protein
MKAAIVAALLLLWSVVRAVAAGAPNVPDPSTLDPNALKFLIPENIQWRPAAGLVGTESSVLVGDPARPGLYVVLNRFHPGNFSRPHYHPNDRYILVISGTWWVATGAAFEPERNTVPMTAGTFVTHPGREVHYDGARSGGEPAIVMIFGLGPGTRTECTGDTAETGPGPCAEARAAAARP